MQGTFELNVPGFYTVQNAELIEEFDPDDYGNRWYNVKFDNDAETYMQLAKDKPSGTLYGHIQKTGSGKRLRFKTDKKPEGVSGPSGPKPSENASQDKYLKDTSDVPRSIVIELLKYYDVQSLWNSEAYTQMIALAQSLNDDIMMMINGNRGTGDTPSKESVVPTTNSAPESGPLRKKWDERAVTANDPELESLEESLSDD